MKVQKLVEIIGADFYTGVPDSQLKALCNYLMAAYGIEPQHHIIAANEETVQHWQRAIIWQLVRFRWFTCRIQERGISSIRSLVF